MNKAQNTRFSPLGRPRRIWAISAIHGEVESLIALHDDLLDRIQPGDRIIYTGNYYGHGLNPAATIDELLTFRRMVLSIPCMMVSDILYLRGQQEEMWHKLQQLPFAAKPHETLLWMLDHGMARTLASYDMEAEDGIRAAREGIPALTKWTHKIRERIRRHPGHDIFTTSWRRAVYTNDEAFCPLLFVNAGIDPQRPLHDQGDDLWWGNPSFDVMEQPYAPFQKVVRGYDPAHKGVKLNCVTATIDGGCGYGGTLICAAFQPDGHIFDVMEA